VPQSSSKKGRRTVGAGLAGASGVAVLVDVALHAVVPDATLCNTGRHKVRGLLVDADSSSYNPTIGKAYGKCCAAIERCM
jgi:hypothetical protein